MAEKTTPAAAADREGLLFLSKLAEQAERFEDMMDYMKKVAVQPQELSLEERNLFSVAYKNVVGARRASWRIVSTLEQKEEAKLAAGTGGSREHMAAIKEYHARIEKELEDICNDVLSILGDHLLPKTTAGESKVFYHKMRGDYYRYLAEFLTGDRRKQVAEASLSSYEAATAIAAAELSTTHPLRLGLALNFSVFYFEIMGVQERACQLAREAFDDAIAQLDTLSEESYKDSTYIMQLLRDNLTLWTSEVDDSGIAPGGASAAQPADALAAADGASRND